jgi:hypothetical protein
VLVSGRLLRLLAAGPATVRVVGRRAGVADVRGLARPLTREKSCPRKRGQRRLRGAMEWGVAVRRVSGVFRPYPN